MPTYSIEGPDGKTYSIDGPPGATREQVIAEIQRQNGPIGAAPKAKPSTAKDVAKSGATGVGVGIRNMLAPVFSGSAQGVVSNALGKLGASENVRAAFEAGSPLGMLRNAENVLGLASGTTRRAVEKAPSRDYVPQTRAGRYAESVGENVVNAAAPGGPVRRVASVVLPGAMGEGAREIASAAGAGEQGQRYAKLAGNILGGAASSFTPTPISTAQPAQRLAKRAGADPAQLQAAVAEKRAAGVEPTLTDVIGPKGRRVLRAVGVKSEAAGETLTNRAREVSSTAKPEIMARTARVGPMQGKTADELQQGITKARDSAATSNYADAYDTIVDVPDTVLDMLHDSSGRSIIARARADAIENQDWGRQVELDKLLKLPDEGGVGPVPRISAGTIDRLVIAARERGAKFAERGNRLRARGAFQRQAQLDSVLDTVDELKPARADYRAKSQAIDVLGKQRQDVFSTDPADYGRWLEGLSPEAKEANKVAIRQEVLDTLGGQRSATFGTVDELATSQYAQQNLRQALGPEADQYLAYLRHKLDQVRNARFVDSEAGSRTAVVGQDMQNLGNVIREGAGAVVEAKTGNFALLMARGAGWLASRGFSESDAQALTRMAVDPMQTDRAIQIINQRLGPEAAKAALDWRRAVLLSAPAVASAQAPSQ